MARITKEQATDAAILDTAELYAARKTLDKWADQLNLYTTHLATWANNCSCMCEACDKLRETLICDE
jgi:hypothetical protein